MAKPFLQCPHRFKNGKDHCYWSIAEKVRTHRGWVQRHLLYWGEVNDRQKAAWTKVIDVFDPARGQTRELALYRADRAVPEHAVEYGVQVRLSEFELRRPRQWGACWVGCQMWEQLQLDEFWRQRLADSREGTSWRQVLQTLTIYRLIDPGSEWRLHREWLKTARGRICWGRISAWRRRTICIGVWTSCWSIVRPCSSTCGSGGKIFSG
jgi:hypothetical protein